MNRVLLAVSLIIVLPFFVWLVHKGPGESAVSYPPFDLTAMSTPGDSAGSITLNWFTLPGDTAAAGYFPDYVIGRGNTAEGPFDDIAAVRHDSPRASLNSRQYRDTTVEIGTSYYYGVSCETDKGLLTSNVYGPVESTVGTAGGKIFGDVALFPPSQLRVFDEPDDDGHSIVLEWKISPNDIFRSAEFEGYDIYRSTRPDGPFELVGDATGGVTDPGRMVKQYADGNHVSDDSTYYYYIDAKWNGQKAASGIAGPVRASQQWFHTGRGVSLILLGILLGTILYYINQAKSGKELFIRKIAGLEAVDEAVGRATEMGKKVFYIPGTQDMDNVQTIAGLTILSRVARLTAEYETRLEVPVSRSLVMVTGREVVKEAYLNAGRPDYYSDDMVYYLTDDQFGYAAGVDGLVVRQKPATIFYQGAFYAESLILAETGNSIGAIQIAGTAMPAQLPFFVAACDYTLIGEELFAASAYLSREPKLLGSLKGQDIGGKLVFLSLALIFILIITILQQSSLAPEIARIFEVH